MAIEHPAGPRQGDILDALWRLFSSPYLTLALTVVVALALLVAAILPQEPVAARNDELVHNQWLTRIYQRYPATGETLLAIGALNVLRSFWFRLLVALLAFNLCLGLVNLAEALWQNRRAATLRRPESFFTAEQSSVFLTTNLPWNEVLESVRHTLAVTLARPKEEHTHSVAYFHADSGPWPLWGALLSYLGVLLMIVGWLMGGWFDWQMEGIRLGIGQQVALHDTPYALRLENLMVEGSDLRAETALLKDGLEIRRGVITLQQPLRGGGFTVQGIGYGPEIVVQAKDGTGRTIKLQSFVAGAEPEEMVHLAFSEPGEERYFAVPERNLVVRLVLVQSEDAETGPSFRIQAYRESMVDPVLDRILTKSERVEIADDHYTLSMKHYALLQVRHSPGDGFVLIGLLLACGGMVLLLWKPRAQVWVMVAAEGGGVTIKARGQAGKSDRRFHRLMAALQRALQAHDGADDGG
ncbi:MAG: cytochrome c biogenesis protein ResB [Anaerolineae bacterium]|jgi:cytochrome c biogenesis protein|nr:cytochrome c biogenesis protein ResB [Anaerolineae bacterium]MDH7474496.1 cytochrome c biogenesis protein ResB [Anaerolineae bacterium]